mgnify:CR=1 FL=1
MSAIEKTEATEHTLGVLGAVETQESLTQRHLARELGIALGLANALVKRCVRKGYIKIREVPAGRYSYYLTPKGFSEKSRLTAEYLTSSLSFFRRARAEATELFAEAQARGWTRLALAGAGDLAEIASLAAREIDIEPVAILDPRDNRPTLAGISIVPRLDAIGDIDGIVVTDIRTPQQTYDSLVAVFGADRVIAPPLLRISCVTPLEFREAV